MKKNRIWIFVACMLTVAPALAMELQLYETGPAQDSSFVRFVNGTADALAVKAKGSKANLELKVGTMTSPFMSVRAETAIEGTLLQGSTAKDVSVKVAPGEFASVVAVTTTSGFDAVIMREQPDDFNATKASIALYHVGGKCDDARIQIAGRTVTLFEKVEAQRIVRRQVNPVRLTVQLVCGGQNTGAPVDFGMLEAGQRYTLMLLPSSTGAKIIGMTDSLAN